MVHLGGVQHTDGIQSVVAVILAAEEIIGGLRALQSLLVIARRGRKVAGEHLRAVPEGQLEGDAAHHLPPPVLPAAVGASEGNGEAS